MWFTRTVDETERPYRLEQDRHLWDLIEHAHERGGLHISPDWADSVWGAISELAARSHTSVDVADREWLRQRLDVRHQLLEDVKRHVGDDLRGRILVEQLEGAMRDDLLHVRADGYEQLPPSSD